MASSKDYLEYILELLRNMDDITYKKMMGEYILYKGSIIFGGIYDNRFLIKKTSSSCALKFKAVVPYPNAKTMLLVDIEDVDEIEKIVMAIVNDIKNGH